jgi:hypothetical protein
LNGGRTPREKQVQARLIRNEKEFLGVYRRNPTRQPDGSFMLAAYRKGYRAAVREIQKREQEGQS